MLSKTTFMRTLMASAAAMAMAAGHVAPLAAQDAPAAQAEAETTEFYDWAEARFEENIMNYPTFLTTLGRPERNDEWNDPSDEFAVEMHEWQMAVNAQMREQFDPEELSADDRLSYRLANYSAELDAAGHEFRNHWFIFNQMYGVQSTTPSFLINQHQVRSVDDAEAYVARLEAMGDYLDAQVAESQTYFDQGIAPPRFVYAHVIEAAENVISGAPFEPGEPSALLADFTRDVDALDLDRETRDDLVMRAVSAMQTSVGPGYERMLATLRQQQAAASTDDGVWRLPNGEAYYEYQLRQFTTTDLTAEEIHQIGLREVERIHGEMREIMEEVGFEGTLQEFFEFTRTDPQFFASNDDAGREEYLELARGYVSDMEEILPQMFNTFPRAPVEVRRVEPFREAASGKGFYQRPSADGSRPGYFYANLRDMNDMPLYQLEALVYHEAIPGHHMQISIAQELENVPSFRRFGGFTAYSEGWGLYSEYLPLEYGMYEDPYSNFGRLAMELWRAARLVVDTGIHHHRWTREEAIAYLMENTPNPEGDCIAAIERYIVMPGQATAYMIGNLEIRRLRDDARERLGDRFDIREFHDVVLANGAVPLAILGELVDEWVERELEAPA